MDPCGIPIVTCCSSERVRLKLTCWIWLDRYDLNHPSSLPSIPYAISFLSNIPWSTVSNAFLRSMIMAIPLKPTPQFKNHQRLQNENPLSSCKVVIFFHFVDVWDGPSNLRTLSDVILFKTKLTVSLPHFCYSIIKSIGNQEAYLCLKFPLVQNFIV